MKLRIKTVSFALDAARILDGVMMSVNGLYSVEGVDSMITAEINFGTATAIKLIDLEGLPLSNPICLVKSQTLQDVRVNQDKRGLDERPGQFL